MKTLIYQYWYGPKMENAARYGKKLMSNYAKQIGADYRFDRDPKFFENICEQAVSFSALMPVFNEDFHKYDAVLTLDMDIFPVEGLQENIFDIDFGEMGICQEAHMAQIKKKYRSSTSDRGYGAHVAWSKRMKSLYGIDMPKDELGLYKIYNSGLVLYSKEGMRKAKERFIHPQKFINQFKPHFKPVLFWRDQAYTHAMFVTAGLNTREVDTAWNSQIHWLTGTKKDPQTGKRPVIDCRTENTKFVHVQLSGSGEWSDQKLWEITNAPEKWTFL